MNPFRISDYIGPDYFCDRNTELSKLLEAFDNDRQCVLYSLRRLGKTGLIHHFQHHLKKRRRKITLVYFDVLSTWNDAAFLSKMATAVINALEKTPNGFITRVGNVMKHLRPVVSFDPATGLPQVTLDIHKSSEIQGSLSAIADMLGKLDHKVQIAIDEFQQIAEYEETTIGASLRGYFHKMKNVHFLFSGSEQHLLVELFSTSGKPMFSSTQHLPMKKIERALYHEFIETQFSKAKIKIGDAEIEEILDWTRCHTFYTQFFCNRLFSAQCKKITAIELEKIKREIFFEFENIYLTFRKVLPENQWRLLTAIAKEGSIRSITADFLGRYRMAESTAREALTALVKKILAFEQLDREGAEYAVYDVFMSRWLETL